MSSQNSSPDRDGFASWGLIVGALVGAVSALMVGGRWWSAVLFLGVLGWVAGGLSDRARSE